MLPAGFLFAALGPADSGDVGDSGDDGDLS